ncbi:MAG: recombinase family protein [Myxococcota bacterium]|nr:recombinase family protein [Myxococcota bacterium]
MLDVAMDSERSPFRAVMVDDLSRLSRDIGDTHAIVFRDLAGAGVKVLDTGGLDSESDSGEMTVAMRSIINREYIRGVSKQTHRGLTGRAIAGFSTLVSGLLKCGTCGGPMSINGMKMKAGIRYAQFACTANRSRGASICANASSISERKITRSRAP